MQPGGWSGQENRPPDEQETVIQPRSSAADPARTAGGPATNPPEGPNLPPGATGPAGGRPLSLPQRPRAPALPAPSVPAAAPAMPGHASLQPGAPWVSEPPAGAATNVAPRAQTLTQQMRAMQPPDVVRQAMGELGVLARELSTLPQALVAAGLAPTHQQSYLEAARNYLGLARLAWEAVAEERLEQAGAEPEYRQRAIAVARRVSQLSEECRSASGNLDFQLPRRVPAFWQRRVTLIQHGLQSWQDRLAPTPDPQEMGRGLFRLRGYVGLAMAGGIEMFLLGLMTTGVIGLLALTGLGEVLQVLGAALSGAGYDAMVSAILLLCTALTGSVILLLFLRGPVSLDLVLGASIYAPTRSTRNTRQGSPAVALALRGWWLFCGFVAILAITGGLAFGAAMVSLHAPAVLPHHLSGDIALGGSIMAIVFGPAAITGILSLALMAVPTLVLTVVRAAAELAGGHSWVPSARRYALEPALAASVTLTTLAVVATWVAATAQGWQQVVLGETAPGGIPVMLSVRAVAVFGAFVLPPLLTLDIPYRVGMRRWRTNWISDLATRRADVESHVRRLSVSDPLSGEQDTSEENLRAMQYDLVLLQFYRDKLEEAEHTAVSPFRLTHYLGALAIAVIMSLLTDGTGAALAHLILPR